MVTTICITVKFLQNEKQKLYKEARKRVEKIMKCVHLSLNLSNIYITLLSDIVLLFLFIYLSYLFEYYPNSSYIIPELNSCGQNLSNWTPRTEFTLGYDKIHHRFSPFIYSCTCLRVKVVDWRASVSSIRLVNWKSDGFIGERMGCQSSERSVVDGRRDQHACTPAGWQRTNGHTDRRPGCCLACGWMNGLKGWLAGKRIDELVGRRASDWPDVYILMDMRAGELVLKPTRSWTDVWTVEHVDALTGHAHGRTGEREQGLRSRLKDRW